MSVTGELAVVLVALGVVAPLLTLAVNRDARAGIAIMLELWTAGGLLRLSGDPSWTAIASVAAIITARKLVLLGLREHAR